MAGICLLPRAQLRENWRAAILPATQAKYEAPGPEEQQLRCCSETGRFGIAGCRHNTAPRTEREGEELVTNLYESAAKPLDSYTNLKLIVLLLFILNIQ